MDRKRVVDVLRREHARDERGQPGPRRDQRGLGDPVLLRRSATPTRRERGARPMMPTSTGGTAPRRTHESSTPRPTGSRQRRTWTGTTGSTRRTSTCRSRPTRPSPVPARCRTRTSSTSCAGAWSVYFDGTAHGLTSGNLDVDAFDVRSRPPDTLVDVESLPPGARRSAGAARRRRGGHRRARADVGDVRAGTRTTSGTARRRSPRPSWRPATVSTSTSSR